MIPKSLKGFNYFDGDTLLQDFLAETIPDSFNNYKTKLSLFGEWVGSEVEEAADYSNRYAPPVLQPYNKDGEKTNNIIFNPLYEKTHKEAYKKGVIGLAFKKNPEPHLLSFVMGYLLSHADISIHCPVTMTGAVAYVLKTIAPAKLRDEFLPLLTKMDGTALSGGTWATELHGGSDVGATTTIATKDGSTYKLSGLKWFTSNANSGIAIATARANQDIKGSKGLGLYLVPSHLENGKPNNYHIRRLKEKIGTKGLATGEIDLENTLAYEIVPPPMGLKAMMEALEYSRIHNTMSATGTHRRAFLEALSWTEHRTAFGEKIINYPMVQDEVLKILFFLEASFALSAEAAVNFDKTLKYPENKSWLRLVTGLAKYQTAEWAVQAVKDTTEIIGGNAYTDEFPMARIMKDVYSLLLWEGPANIQAIEVARMCTGKNKIGFNIYKNKIQELTIDSEKLWPGEFTIIRDNLSVIEQLVSAMQKDTKNISLYARKAMVAMSETLAIALLCKKAACKKNKNNDFRYFLVAKGLVNLLHQEKKPGTETVMHKHFFELLNYKPVNTL